MPKEERAAAARSAIRGTQFLPRVLGHAPLVFYNTIKLLLLITHVSLNSSASLDVLRGGWELDCRVRECGVVLPNLFTRAFSTHPLHVSTPCPDGEKERAPPMPSGGRADLVWCAGRA